MRGPRVFRLDRGPVACPSGTFSNRSSGRPQHEEPSRKFGGAGAFDGWVWLAGLQDYVFHEPDDPVYRKRIRDRLEPTLTIPSDGVHRFTISATEGPVAVAAFCALPVDARPPDLDVRIVEPRED